MRKWLLRLLLLALLAAIFWVLRVTVLAPAPAQVQVERIGLGRVEATITNSKAGTIRARRRAKLSPGTSGTVVEVLVERGAKVNAGDLLLRLDDATQVAALEVALRAEAVALAMHTKACISSERAERELARNRELGKTIVSDDLLDRLSSNWSLAKAECSVAEAEVERARASVEAARAELEKTRLRAPFEAIIAEKSVELGEWVTPSVPLLAAPDLFDAIDPSSLYISAPMDEVDAGKLATGQRVRVTIDPYPNQQFEGRVARVAPYVLDLEKQNRTIEVEVELVDQDFSRTLLPGTSADVEVILEVKESVLRAPARALLEGGRVLVLVDGRLQDRKLELGLRNWDWVEVLGGVSSAEEIVTSLDLDGIAAGMRAEALP